MPHPRGREKGEKREWQIFYPEGLYLWNSPSKLKIWKMQPWRKVKYKIERNKYETNRRAGANSYIKISHTFKTKRVQDKRIKKLWNGRAFTWDFLIIQQRSHAVLKFQTFMAVRQSATTRRRVELTWTIIYCSILSCHIAHQYTILKYKHCLKIIFEKKI